MTEAPSGSGSFLEDLEFDYREAGDGFEGQLTVGPEALVSGHDQVRTSVLASVADVITGVLVSTHIFPSIALTVDLAVRIIAPFGAGTVAMGSRVVKVGRTTSATEAWFSDGDRTLAHCWATFMASPRPQDTQPPPPLRRDRGPQRLPAPFADALGIRVHQPGVAEVDRRPYTLQPAGTLQGGVVCALAEVAAESLAGNPVTEIDVRYLAAVREGPGRATATHLGGDLTQITIVDAGREDHRIASMAFARTAATR